MTEVKKTPSFWGKPESAWGAVILLGLAGLTLWFLSWFVPFMLKLGLGLLGVAAVWGTIAGLGLAVFTDNPLRQAVILKVQLTAKKLRSAVIDEDPIGVLRLLQTRARKRLQEFEEMLPSVRKSKQITSRAMADYSNKMAAHKAAATIARNKGDYEEETRALGKFGKADQYHSEMLGLMNGIEGADALLAKARKAVERIIEDAEDEINNEEIRLKATSSYSGVMGKLRSVFKTSSNEDELRKEALRSAADKVSARLGEIDQFTQDFNEMLSGMNNADAVNAEMAKQKLQSLGKYQLDNNPAPRVGQVKSKVSQAVAYRDHLHL
jgi:hypothetical protein